jgi:subtilisin family serine protease
MKSNANSINTLLLCFGLMMGGPVAAQLCDPDIESRELIYITDSGERQLLNASTRYALVPASRYDSSNTAAGVIKNAERADFEILDEYGLVLLQLHQTDDQDAQSTIDALCADFDGQVFEAFEFGDDDVFLINEIIVKFRESTDESDWSGILRDYGININGCDTLLLVERRYVCRLPVRASLDVLMPRDILDVVNDLKRRPEVEYAMPNFILLTPSGLSFQGVEDADAPDDQAQPQTYEDWPDDQIMPDQELELGKINARGGWDVTIGSCDVRIAILDNGVELAPPDLEPKIIGYYDAVKNAKELGTVSPGGTHGTPVAGIAAAMTNNDGLGVAGTIWGGKILAIRVFETSGDTLAVAYSRIVDGMVMAIAMGANVLNNSWGFEPEALETFATADFDDAIDFAIGKNTVLVYSVGNGTTNDIKWPARLSTGKDIVAVGATNQDGNEVITRGNIDDPRVTVVAPGVAIDTTDLTGFAGYTSGDYMSNFGDASAAVPYVSGAVALLLSWAPEAELKEVIDWLKDKATKETFFVAGAWGSGRLDIGAALANIKNADLSVTAVIDPAGPMTVGEERDVRVRVSRNGIPLSGVIVSFQSSDDSAASIMPAESPRVTDCDGFAVASLAAGPAPATADITAFIGPDIANALGSGVVTVQVQ